MASCRLGASNVKIPNLNFRKSKVDFLLKPNEVRTSVGKREQQYAALLVSQRSEKAFRVYCGPSSETQPATNLVDDSEENKPSGLISQLIPNLHEVESLLTEICNTTSVAEFELKLGGFRLYVMRDLIETSGPPPELPSPPSAVTANTDTQVADSNGSAAATSLAITKPLSLSGGVQRLLDKAADEGLVLIQSSKVGYFRRSRTIKGKRAPLSCKEKQIVKEGQVICYVEQLGCDVPIESDVTGEVVKIIREDGEPVGYGDALIAVLPSFPGIKLQ